MKQQFGNKHSLKIWEHMRKTNFDYGMIIGSIGYNDDDGQNLLILTVREKEKRKEDCVFCDEKANRKKETERDKIGPRWWEYFRGVKVTLGPSLLNSLFSRLNFLCGVRCLNIMKWYFWSPIEKKAFLKYDKSISSYKAEYFINSWIYIYGYAGTSILDDS